MCASSTCRVPSMKIWLPWSLWVVLAHAQTHTHSHSLHACTLCALQNKGRVNWHIQQKRKQKEKKLDHWSKLRDQSCERTESLRAPSPLSNDTLWWTAEKRLADLDMLSPAHTRARARTHMHAHARCFSLHANVLSACVCSTRSFNVA